MVPKVSTTLLALKRRIPIHEDDLDSQHHIHSHHDLLHCEYTDDFTRFKWGEVSACLALPWTYYSKHLPFFSLSPSYHTPRDDAEMAVMKRCASSAPDRRSTRKVCYDGIITPCS